MPGAGDQAFEEHDTAAERTLGLGAGALVGVGQLVGGVDHADTAATAARGRLEHQRVADRGGGGMRGVQVGHRATAPRRDRDPDLLGEQLGADLVTEPAHRVGAGPHEGDAQTVAQFDEGGLLGDEAPAHPRGVGTGLDQGAFEHVQVEVRPARGGSEAVGVVGLTHEGGVAVDVGVERHRLPLRPTVGVALPDGVDQPHRGFSPVHDGDTAKHRQPPPAPVTTHGTCLPLSRAAAVAVMIATHHVAPPTL